jgi:hypothetical protein
MKRAVVLIGERICELTAFNHLRAAPYYQSDYYGSQHGICDYVRFF